MAQIIRLISQPIRCNAFVKSAQLLPISSKPFIESKRQLFGFGKKDEEMRLPDPIEHATGLEKLLLLAAEKGIDDPFCLKPRARGAGTKGQYLFNSFEYLFLN